MKNVSNIIIWGELDSNIKKRVLYLILVLLVATNVPVLPKLSETILTRSFPMTIMINGQDL